MGSNNRDSRKSILFRIRPFLRLLKNFRGSPEAIAGGFSLGLFLALTPTIGVQLVVAVFLATVFKLSRPAALLAVMITNPLTVPPIFTFNYWVGKWFFDGPSVGEVYVHLITLAKEMAQLNFWQVVELMRVFAVLGQDMLLPLLFGSLLVASLSAGISYFLLARLLWFLKQHKERKLQLRKSRIGSV